MIHFISGYPRSGSTLLAALLRQNPDFHSGIISPLGPMTLAMQDAFSAGSETQMMVSEVARLRILRGLFLTYYEGVVNLRTVFDTNRRWCAVLPLLDQLFPQAKVICCVRPQVEVINSFEKVFAAHPAYTSRIVDLNANATVYQRVQSLMGGVAGFAFDAFADAYHGAYRHKLIIVEYKKLAQDPCGVLEEIHWKIGEPRFDYNPECVSNIPGTLEFDSYLGAPGLHSVRPQVRYEPSKITLPPDVVAKLPVPIWR